MVGGGLGGGSVGTGVSVDNGISVGVGVSVGIGGAAVGASVAWGTAVAGGAEVGSADPSQAMRTAPINNRKPMTHRDRLCNDLRILPVLYISGR